MLESIRTDPHWPAFIANIEALTDAQLAARGRTESGRLQLAAFMVATVADDSMSGLRERVMRVTAGALKHRLT